MTRQDDKTYRRTLNTLLEFSSSLVKNSELSCRILEYEYPETVPAILEFRVKSADFKEPATITIFSYFFLLFLYINLL